MHPETVHELENRLMMFYTYIQRDANGILAEQSKKAKEDERKAVEAMHEIKRIGRAVKAALAEGDINRFGKLLHEHWLAKKGISNQMTNDMINACYEAALQNGAIGGKIMGAGGGGFLLLCAEEGRRKHLRKVMEAEGLKFMDFRLDWDGSKVLVNF
jgi:D-glycero-alpha-D-manno-heptose-7-phosphate kinase